jgi:hypothetical protein
MKSARMNRRTPFGRRYGTIQIHKRVEKLTARIFLTGNDQHTLEELCRLLWRQDKRGFLALANGDPHRSDYRCSASFVPNARAGR